MNKTKFMNDLNEIVYNGTLAPSPFNIQAVKYVFNYNNYTLNIYLDQDRAYMKPLTSEHTFKEHCIGVGGNVENIRIAADHLGYSTEVEYCPDQNDRFFLAKIKFIEGGSQSNDLYPFLAKSWTSRAPMIEKEIPEKDIAKIKEIVNNYNDILRAEIITDKEEMLKVAKLSAKAETMNWSLKSTQSKHRSFLKFSKKVMSRQRDGIGFWEFGVPSVFGAIFKFLTKWNIYRLLIPLGMARYVGWSSRLKKGKTVKNFTIIVLKETEDVKRWLIGGEAVQKIFLETTKRGIDHQFYSSIYIWDDVINGLGDIRQVNQKFQKKAADLSAELRNLIPLKNDYVLAALAFGYTGKQMNPKYRRSVDQVLTIAN